MATITVDLPNAGKLFRRLGDQLKPTLLLGARSAAAQMLPIMVKQTQNAPPASPRGSRGAFNTGDYRRRWKATAQIGGTEGNPGVLVSNSAPYAGVIEYGRRPGSRPPPREPIARWAQRKLGLPYAEARGLSWVIAQRIAKRGLMPRRVLTSDQTEKLLVEALERDVLHELIAAVRRS